MIERIREAVAESLRLKQNFFSSNEANIAGIARAIGTALEGGNKILLFGNGGSAADAQHIAAEWVGRFVRERRPLAALALTTDSSILTSVSNDYGYEHVFDRQIRALGRPGDVAIAISTSGNSPNVCLAAVTANVLGLVTVGLTGGNGGKLGGVVRHHLNVPHRSAARVQETHIMIGHILCDLVDETMKGL
jgi:D-sedoheptulose 7-phosphate isomerase